ncbi:MAG: pseudaminic acid cytidylyltransferase [Kiritimatiellia bacterium]|jgi:pseudaminic acid cytidylyltransferase
MSAIAMIPARGGSKRIPRKNIRDFCGKPIIAYSIEAALEAGCFDVVMCSTDDHEIAEVAKRHGAEVPFMRSAETSGDFATTADVIAEVVNEYGKRGMTFDYLCCIYPAAPFAHAARIRTGFNALVASDATCAMPVVRFSHPIQRALRMNGGKLEMCDPAMASARSQDLEPTYHDAGQYYWYKMAAFRQNASILLQNPIAIEIPESEVQDIDTEEDWGVAELKFRMLEADGAMCAKGHAV